MTEPTTRKAKTTTHTNIECNPSVFVAHVIFGEVRYTENKIIGVYTKKEDAVKACIQFGVENELLFDVFFFEDVDDIREKELRGMKEGFLEWLKMFLSAKYASDDERRQLFQKEFPYHLVDVDVDVLLDMYTYNEAVFTILPFEIQ